MSDKFIDKDGYSTESETPYSCVIIGEQNYVKANGAVLYDPHGLFATPNELLAVDPFKDKKIYQWVSVNKEVAEMYEDFLVSGRRLSYNKAQSLLYNAPYINGPNKFKRSPR
jgi:hypothetical protein